MTRNLYIILFFWLGGLLAFENDYQALYNDVLAYLRAHQAPLIAYGTVSSASLVLFSLFLGQLRWFGQLYLLARLSFEVSQSVICLLSFAAVAFWFDFNRLVWQDLGWELGFLPFAVMLASCLSLWIFDFNYPLQHRILRNLALPLFSALLVHLASIFLA